MTAVGVSKAAWPSREVWLLSNTDQKGRKAEPLQIRLLAGYMRKLIACSIREFAMIEQLIQDEEGQEDMMNEPFSHLSLLREWFPFRARVFRCVDTRLANDHYT